MVSFLFKKRRLAIAVAILLFSSCQKALKPEQLYGKWRYIHIENANKSSPDSVRAYELQIDKPYIEFDKKDSLHIWWGGRIMTRGTYKVTDQMIQVNEILPDGQTRRFPFYVSKITDKDLIFETKGDEGSKVTTVKEDE